MMLMPALSSMTMGAPVSVFMVVTSFRHSVSESLNLPASRSWLLTLACEQSMRWASSRVAHLQAEDDHRLACR